MRFFNQYSFLLLAGSVGLVLLFSLWRWRQANPLLRAGLLAWYGLGVLVIALVWRYPTNSALTTTAQVESLLANGRPTLVMLYSNYWLGCLSQLSAVRGLTPDLDAAGINTMLLDVHAAPGRDLLDRFNFVSTPTFLFYSADGREIIRSSTLPDLTTLRQLN